MLGFIQAAHETLGDLGGQLIEQGHAVIGVEGVEEGGEGIVAKRIHQIRLMCGIQGLEGNNRALPRQQTQDQRSAYRRHPLQHMDEILQRNGAQQLRDPPGTTGR